MGRTKFKNIALIIGLWVFVNLVSKADSTLVKQPKWQHTYALSTTFNSSVGAICFGWDHHYPLNKKRTLRIGYGVRLTTTLGLKDLNYTTANASQLSNVQNIDTFKLSQPSTGMLNLKWMLMYAISQRFEIGFDLDFTGISLGSQQKGILAYHQSTGKSPIGTDGSPTFFNLLIFNNNDIGNLQSEFYITYRLNPVLAIKAVYAHMFTEYSIDQHQRPNIDRFRLKSDLFGVGIQIRPYYR